MLLRSHPFVSLLMFVLALAGPPAIRDPEPVGPDAVTAPATLPPASPHAGDPADSLYQAAREALTRSDFGLAARLFDQILEEYPDSAYAADSLYWRGFALYRSGDLRSALAALEEQRERFPDAATRRDGEALAVRIHGELAQRGDSDAAARVAMEASRVGDCPDEDDESDVRIAALNALLQMDSERAMPILRQILSRRDACSIGLRRKAVFLVAQHETSETEDVLLETARDDPDSEVREQAVFWLSQVDTDRSVTALEGILQADGDPALQEKALFALSQHDSDRAHLILQRFADRTDVPADLRERAIFWLGQSESPHNVAFLRTLFGRLTDPDLRERVLFSLSQIDEPGTADWLLEVATTVGEDLEIRKKALFWAGQSDAPIVGLLDLYDRMEEPELKEQLIFVYSQRNDELEVVDRLIDIARRESDPELRKKAIFWLGQMEDPRVADFLGELIND